MGFIDGKVTKGSLQLLLGTQLILHVPNIWPLLRLQRIIFVTLGSWTREVVPPGLPQKATCMVGAFVECHELIPWYKEVLWYLPSLPERVELSKVVWRIPPPFFPKKPSLRSGLKEPNLNRSSPSMTLISWCLRLKPGRASMYSASHYPSSRSECRSSWHLYHNELETLPCSYQALFLTAKQLAISKSNITAMVKFFLSNWSCQWGSAFM